MIGGGRERVVEVAFHESELPGAFAARLVEGLRARALPGEWLYHYPAQARLWLAYHQAYSPSRADPAMAGLYREAFARALESIGDSPPHAVSLGCGGGQKDGELIALVLKKAVLKNTALKDAMLKGATPEDSPLYTPVDASPALVLEAALHVGRRFPTLPIRPLVADLSGNPDLVGRLASVEKARMPRLFTCFGMVPNMDAKGFPAYLAALLSPADVLLVSANLSPAGLEADRARILPQYDNPEARRWYLAALEAVGIRESDVALTVAAQPLAGGNFTGEDSAWRIVVEARFAREKAIQLFGEEVGFAEGERLRVFHSNRFTVQALGEVLERAGLHPHQQWLHPSGEEGIFRCGRGGT